MKNLLEAINQARYIHTLCNMRAREMRCKAKGIRRSNNTAIWIKQDRQIDALNAAAETLENRGTKVWFSVTAFQGKYINWKNIHTIDGQTYCGIFELIEAAEKHQSANRN
jgi:hypothetical protein